MTQPKTASKFTPGPWNAKVDVDRERFLIDSPSIILAITCGGNDAANARLIAKAPEMYEMLSGLLKAITKEDEHGSTPLCYKCVQVLSRSISEAHRIKAEIDRKVTP